MPYERAPAVSTKTDRDPFGEFVQTALEGYGVDDPEDQRIPHRAQVQVDSLDVQVGGLGEPVEVQPEVVHSRARPATARCPYALMPC